MGDNVVLAFLLALIPLVVIHEFGHFIMAKLGGIEVYKFCVGFGKRLFGFTYKGTEYCFNLLPLGGYVDFMGELIYSGEIPEAATHFYNRPKWLRFLVLIMGPAFNIILAFLLYWLCFSIHPVSIPKYEGEPCTVGYVDAGSPEERAGLRVSDRIVSFQGKPVDDFDTLQTEILLLPNREVTLGILRENQPLSLTYRIPAHEKEGFGLQAFGPWIDIMVSLIQPGSPAEKAGLKVGDVLLMVNDEHLRVSVSEKVNQQISARAPAASRLTVRRFGGQLLEMDVAPELRVNPDTGKEQWLIGLGMQANQTSKKLNVLEAGAMAWTTFKHDSTMLFKALQNMAKGILSLKMLGGVVGVARVANEAMKMGLVQFLMLMAFLSLNLGIMNLLPIPVLDGGEILVLLVEGIIRRDFSLNTKFRIKLIGFFILIPLMILVTISDVIKIF